MKRKNGNTPTVTLHTDNPACPRVLSIKQGTAKSRRNIGLILHRSGKAELFLVCQMGTAGRKTSIQWHARVLPEQIDNLISCLSAARKELPALMAKSRESRGGIRLYR